MPLTLSLLDQTFTVHRFDPDAIVPANVLETPIFSITRTKDELSIVAPESMDIQSVQSEPGWGCFKVHGPLQFNLTGILAGLASVLSDVGISVFAVSTFDTDYIFVKQEQVKAAKEAFISAGYRLSPT